MRIKKSQINEMFIVLIAFLSTNFLGFYKYMPFGSDLYSVDYMMICIFIVSLCTILLCLIKRKGKLKAGFNYKALILYMLLLVLIEIPYTYFQYHQPIVQAIKEGSYYLIPLVCYVAYWQVKKGEQYNTTFILDVIVKTSLLASLVACFAFVLYTFAGVNILKLADSSDTNFRYGTIRFGVGTSIVFFGLLISITRILHKAYSKIDIANVILGLVQIIVINKTRTSTAYLLVVVLLAVVRERKVKPFIKVFIYLICLMSIMFVMVFADEFVVGISSYFANDAGIAIRFSTIDFYLKQFFEKPILGMGFLSASKELPGWQLRYGNSGYFYRDDVGIIGLINTLGIAGLVWIVAFLLSLNRRRKKLTGLNAAVVTNLLVYLTITLVNLSFLDSQRVMFVFWIMVIAEVTSIENGYLHKIKTTN